MNLGLSAVYARAQKFSRLSAIVAILAFIALKVLGIQLSISVQLVIALGALLLGVPHGAVDHLISISSKSKVRFVLFIVIYVAIAVAAGFGITTWNIWGFRLVLIMSALHFGYGDAAFAGEWRIARGVSKEPFILENLYAIPAGALPIVLPLTDSRSISALNRIHGSLSGWAGSMQNAWQITTLVVALIAIAVLLLVKNYEPAIDLTLLLLLSLIAPALITFAIYFGCWHAVRHTARLVPKLPRAHALATAGESTKAIWAAIVPGLYAVAGTVAVGLGLMLALPGRFGSGMLWSTLVVVWSLTVPHMIATARFDLKAL
jgi:Brp/Blh family beta-carotene 15,15'-monooxygenase